MDYLDIFKQQIDDYNFAQLSETIPFGALQLNQDYIHSVHFVFWLIYMSESDLNDVLKVSWETALVGANENTVFEMIQTLNEAIQGEKRLDPSNLEFFSDKIKIYESFYGKDNRTKLFWKLNDIRNDLSHGRITALTYDGESLNELDTCKRLLRDYFDSVSEEKDWTQSMFYKNLSEEERKIVESQFTLVPKKISS
jgi:hypothetical protein